MRAQLLFFFFSVCVTVQTRILPRPLYSPPPPLFSFAMVSDHDVLEALKRRIHRMPLPRSQFGRALVLVGVPVGGGLAVMQGAIWWEERTRSQWQQAAQRRIAQGTAAPAPIVSMEDIAAAADAPK